VGATTLGPDQETTVSLTMMMHKGMEGPHLFRVTVPLQSATSTAGGELEMFFAADFE
jgi:hypothetical protein